MKKEIGKFMEYPDFEDALVGTLREKRNTKRVSLFDYWHDGDGAADTTAVEMRINGHPKVYGLNEVAEILGYDRMRFGEDGVQLFKTVDVPEEKTVTMTDEEIRARYAERPQEKQEPQDEEVFVATITVLYDPEPLHQFMRNLKRMLFR